MSVMHFIPELAEYLRQNRRIYTVRAYHYSTSEATVPDVGLCRRELIARLSDEDVPSLKPYVDESGFTTLKAWISKIRHFIPSGRVMYLYRVKLVYE